MSECFMSAYYNQSAIVQKTFEITKQAFNNHSANDCQVIIMITQNTFNKHFVNDCPLLVYYGLYEHSTNIKQSFCICLLKVCREPVS